ncbi:hypothetical protein ACQEVG_32985 [Streptomyces sp. CA-135486]|uniref:hypothetical protein n=1 Tax=Streptomyces sp. CA-135486 TaxID=3240049 RepID=UPI003D947D8F
MTEYGVFNDEGCIYVADTRDEAEAEAAKERAADDGYHADLISVHEMCPDHRDDEQPKDGCEECAAEVDEEDEDAANEDPGPSLEDYAKASRIVQSLIPGVRR